MTTTEPAVTIPDEIGCVYGWRTWRWNAETLRLEPYFISADTTWANKHTTASCFRIKRICAEINDYEALLKSYGGFLHTNSVTDRLQNLRDMLHTFEVNAHTAPDPSCLCGLYAAKAKYAVPGVWDNGLGYVPIDKNVVLGKVKMWGKVIEYEDGYRAEHAEIISIVDTPSAAEASWQYDVPLESPIGTTPQLRRVLFLCMIAILMLVPSTAVFLITPTLFSLLAMIVCFVITWTFTVSVLPRTRLRYVWQAIRASRSEVSDGNS